MKALPLGAAFFVMAAIGQAHVGSPDVYLEGKAGPYQLFVTVRPPLTIPGVAEVEVRAESTGVQKISAVPLAIAGEGSKYAPIADALKVSPQDAQYFTGSLWMMTSGSWEVRLSVEGAQGPGVLAVPVPSFARASKGMELGLGSILSVLGLFLVVGMVAMIGAATREAKLDAGVEPTAENVRSGRKATVIGAVIVLAIVVGGKAWWNSEANDYSGRIYKSLAMSARLQGAELALTMSEPGWMQADSLELAAFRVFTRKMDDLIPDHGHIMHLYAIRQPGLDAVYHLHPEQGESGTFHLTLPTMAAGHYKLYADIVHANGFPETMVTELDIPALTSRPLAGDDAYALTQPWQEASTTQTVFTLPDGYKMEWLRGDKPLVAKQPVLFRFRLTQADGAAPADMALYMGMPGHAAFVKTDGSVFAHIHPNGSVSMAALMLASGEAPMSHAGMQMEEKSPTLPDTVSFPYGFPTPGRYRIFVQMKHGETVETGAFDALVSGA